MNDRIKLAEAMGMTVAPITYEDVGSEVLVTTDPASTVLQMDEAEWDDFDPFEDANDCDALKCWLRDYGWHIEIRWQAHTNLCPAPAVYVEIWNEASEIHHRYDSDRGEPFTVATTALKVLEL